MQPLLVLVSLDEFFNLIFQVFQILVFIGADFLPFQYLDKTIAAGFALRVSGRLMLEIIACCCWTTTYSAEPY